MRDLQQWLDEYSESHQNPRNKRIHYWCVPAIVVCTVALLWLIPLPYTDANIGQLLLIFAMGFYGLLSLRLALAMLPFMLAIAVGIMAYQAHIELALWIPAGVIWLIAWYFQFVGHKAEAKQPSFFTDVLFLLIGPLWILAALMQRLGMRYH
ncbi:putative membrane protein [Spongiibacter sp. IMCC21906]|uniref:Mpo1 family 2-hydroxy fatty acid dioxygenase n=1 Tax=Spongiibacter sp. IMCC21906 TaxID=1620392 RepID=UPI00062E09A8|nr:Mpo1-like protein [Spongiibacter sp. IMCC21906]AKH68337.1 putative membrane protein [Spongiibacter sp. IMCC21906]